MSITIPPVVEHITELYTWNYILVLMPIDKQPYAFHLEFSHTKILDGNSIQFFSQTMY